jgi:hypothetical protein
MQDRYAGDVGDFGKFALLRALGSDLRVGIVWYLTSELNENNNDGRHLKYLENPDRFRDLDCELFDLLKSFHAEFDKNGEMRCVKQLEQCELLHNACFYSSKVPLGQMQRAVWFNQILESEIAQSDIIFVDPDNGIEGRSLSPKHVGLAELAKLRSLGKALVVYHHQGRVRGGASAEAAILFEKMLSIGCKDINIIRLRPYSSRFYIIADHGDAIAASLSTFVQRWQDSGLVEVHEPHCHNSVVTL